MGHGRPSATKKHGIRRNASIASVSADNAPAVTGQPMHVFYIRNTQGAPAPYGMDFGQDLEPAGRYMNIGEDSGISALPGWEQGYIEFTNPLVLEHKNTTSTGWKKDLSEMYGGKTGKELSDAIKEAGYDAVVTWDEYGFNETVDLGGKPINRERYLSKKR